MHLGFVEGGWWVQHVFRCLKSQTVPEFLLEEPRLMAQTIARETARVRHCALHAVFCRRQYHACCYPCHTSCSCGVTFTGTFAFIETYAVPFYAVSTKSWITYGTLTSDAGLSATLMYGFAAPDGQNLMMAGSLQGAVRDR
jgi:hypothetical protein